MSDVATGSVGSVVVKSVYKLADDGQRNNDVDYNNSGRGRPSTVVFRRVYNRSTGSRRSSSLGLVLRDDLSLFSYKGETLVSPSVQEEAAKIFTGKYIVKVNDIPVHTPEEASLIMTRANDTVTLVFGEASPMAAPAADRGAKRKNVELVDTGDDSSPPGAKQRRTDGKQNDSGGATAAGGKVPKLLKQTETHVNYRVMSYNVLAPWAASQYTRELYQHTVHDSKMMSWENRWALMLKELTKYDADILAFQEVSQRESRDVTAYLRKHKYRWHYVKKKSSTGEELDGPLLAWKSDRFAEDENIPLPHILRFNEISDTKLRKPQIAIQHYLRPREAPERVIMASNIHVYFHPSRGDVKRKQIELMVGHGKAFLKRQQEETPLVSAWAEGTSTPTGNHGEPAFTSSHGTFRNTADYVWLYGAETISSVFPDPSLGSRYVGLPSVDHGSDHLPVVVDVRVPKTEGRTLIMAGDWNVTPGSLLHRFIKSGANLDKMSGEFKDAKPDTWGGPLIIPNYGRQLSHTTLYPADSTH